MDYLQNLITPKTPSNTPKGNNFNNFSNILNNKGNNTPKSNISNNLTSGGEIVSNYLLVVSISVALVILLIMYFLSKSFRVGRTIDTMKLYQGYQEIVSYPFEKQGSVRLGNCRIASSYNSCHSGYQMLDYTSDQVLLSVLRCGVRYVEFNVFNSEFGKKAIPVVSNGYRTGEWKMMFNDTPLETCFNMIAKNAFSVLESDGGVPNPEDPIIIGLNLNTNSNLDCLNQIAELILDYFQDNLLDTKYSYQSSNDIPNIKMQDLRQKVIIFASDGFQGSRLEEIVNYSWDNINKDPNHSLQRIYYKDIEEGKINPDELLQYNTRGMTIVIPHQEGDFLTRNYYPQLALDLGCQLICMNWQYIDSNIDTYVTLFKNKGIIAKPKELINGRSTSSNIPTTTQPS